MPSGLRLKRRSKRFYALIAISIGLAIYSNQIEPYNIEVTHHHIFAPLKSPIKIAHLSDLHTNGLGRREQKMLAILEAEKPNLIILTGDQILFGGNYDGCREVLKQLQAPLGVYVVPGNHDNWYPPPEGRDFYDSIGLNYLVNQNKQVQEGLWIIGLEDAMTSHPNFEKAKAGVPEAAYKIVFFHSPAAFDEVAGQCDLVFAGHSHGGQVRFPFFKPFYLPRGCNDYVEGWFERDGSKMYVSRGIGTSILPLRFNCRPEISIVTLGL